MRSFPLIPIATLPLAHAGDCTLRGVYVDDDGGIVVYVEEMYGADGWLAQGAIRLDGTWIARVDEGADDTITPIPLPSRIKTPRGCWSTMRLNYAGPRHRGLRDPERLIDVLRPVGIADKFAVVKQLGLTIPPPLLLGVAESYVLSEATVLHPDLFFVCRRLRLAYALENERIDADGLPYDYDTRVVHTAHFYDRKTADSEPPLIDALTKLTPAILRRPMDCLVVDDLLFIADAARDLGLESHDDSSDDPPSMIHVWRIEIPDDARRRPSEEERLYG